MQQHHGHDCNFLYQYEDLSRLLCMTETFYTPTSQNKKICQGCWASLILSIPFWPKFWRSIKAVVHSCNFLYPFFPKFWRSIKTVVHDSSCLYACCLNQSNILWPVWLTNGDHVPCHRNSTAVTETRGESGYFSIHL